MSIADFVIIGIILISAILGLRKGLMKMVYKVGSYIASFYLAIKFSKPVSIWFSGTGVYSNIQKGIQDLVANLGIDFTAMKSHEGAQSIEKIISGLPFPENFQKMIAESVANIEGSVATTMENFINETSSFVLVIICGIVLFLLSRLLFWLGGFLIKGIAEVPIIKQVDRLTGFFLGAAMGVMIIFVISLILTYVATWEKLEFVYTSIENGKIAPFFYNQNPLTHFFNLVREEIL